MTNELIQKTKRKLSKRKQISVILNPMKSGKHSKYFNPDVVEYLRNPELFARKIIENVSSIENNELDVREQIIFTNLLTNIFKLFSDYSDKKKNLLTSEQIKQYLDSLPSEQRIELLKSYGFTCIMDLIKQARNSKDWVNNNSQNNNGSQNYEETDKVTSPCPSSSEEETEEFEQEKEPYEVDLISEE